MDFEINDCVKILQDIPEKNLKKGMVGVIVMKFTLPEIAFEVEFVDEHGVTTEQVVLLPREIEGL